MSCCLPKKTEIVDHVGEDYIFGPATLSLREDWRARGLGRRTIWIDYTFALTNLLRRLHPRPSEHVPPAV